MQSTRSGSGAMCVERASAKKVDRDVSCVASDESERLRAEKTVSRKCGKRDA